MAISRGPKLVTNGLVLALDASDDNSFAAQNLPIKNGLLLWLDAADDDSFIYSSGTVVSQWRDKSGLNNHTNQSNVAYQPQRNTFTNSRKTTVFNSSYLTTQTNILKAYTSYTKIAVVKQTSNAVGNIIGKSTGADTTFWYNGSNNIRLYHNASTILTSSVATTLNTWSILSGLFDSNLLNANIYVNGSSGGSATSPTVTQITTDSDVEIGGFNGAASYFAGEISEILIYNRALSLTELKQVHTYLGQKWGISNTDKSIADISGNNNIASFGGAAGSQTVANMPDYDSYNKGALTFNGSSDEVNLGDVIKFTATQDFTLEVWVNYLPNATSYVPLLSKEDSPGFGYALKVDETYGYQPYLVITGTTSAYRYANVNINDGVWHHIVGVAKASSTTIDMYVDGVLINGVASLLSWAGTATTNALRLGKNYGSAFFKGKLSNSKIYNKALSAAEVLQNYEAQKSKFANTIVQSGLVLNLDAGNIYSYAGAGTTFYDVSPTALSWTINNATYNSSDPKYFSYNGSNSWLESSTSAAYDSQTITMECWCYPNSLNQLGFIFEKGAVNTQYSMFFENANFQFRTMGLSNQDVTITSASHMTVNAWNHIVCTYASGNKITYINGVQAGGLSGITGTLNTGGTNQYIGKYGNAGNNYQFNGRIAESRVYNIALSAPQVLQNYNATKGRFGL